MFQSCSWNLAIRLWSSLNAFIIFITIFNPKLWMMSFVIFQAVAINLKENFSQQPDIPKWAEHRGDTNCLSL